MVGHAIRVQQRLGSTDVRHALETGQVVLVPYSPIQREGGLKKGRKPRCTRQRMSCRRTRGLKAYPLTLAEERAHVEALSSALAAYGTSVRQGIEQADTLGDTDTADMFTEISRGVDKYLWFVEAHLG